MTISIQSYLLRLWRADDGEACRVMLEHIDSHEQHGFASLEDLCAFLHEQANGSGENQNKRKSWSLD